MPEFEYVTKREAQPIKNDIIALIYDVQDYVRECFTLDFRFVGSSSRNMITREKYGNKGFDFDVNLIPNVYNDEYAAYERRNILFEAIQDCMEEFGYTKIENSTSVITIKVPDAENSRIEHSCDFAIIRKLQDSREQYIHFHKERLPFNPPYSFCWEYRKDDYYIWDKYQWIKENDLYQELLERYLINKNNNYIYDKKSREILIETVNSIYNQYRNELRNGLTSARIDSLYASLWGTL